MLITNKDLKIKKGAYSAIPNNYVDVPKGSRVDLIRGEYFVSPNVFKNPIDRHDASHYGFRVKAEDVESY